LPKIIAARRAQLVRCVRDEAPLSLAGVAEGREHAGQDHGPVPDRVHRDADSVGGARVLADGADPQPDRGPEQHQVGDDQDAEQEPDHQIQLPEHARDARDAADARQADVGHHRHVGGRALVAVDVDEHVPGDAKGEEVHGGADHDLVGAQVDGEDGMDGGEQAAGDHGHEQSDDP